MIALNLETLSKGSWVWPLGVLCILIPTCAPPYPSLQGMLAPHQELYFGSCKVEASTVSCLLTGAREGQVGICLIQRKEDEKKKRICQNLKGNVYFHFYLNFK